MTQPIFDKLYRPDEVAELLGISKRTVYRMIERYELNASRSGLWWRIPGVEIKRILAKWCKEKS